MTAIEYFKVRTRYGFLSPFYHSPFTTRDGKEWPTAVHYIEAMKYQGTPYEDEIRNAQTAVRARIMGTKQRVKVKENHIIHQQMKDKYCVRNGAYGPRKDWEKIKVPVVKNAIRQKYKQHPKLKKKLLETGEADLIYVNPHDRYLGVGQKRDGLNVHGKLLEAYREANRTNRATEVYNSNEVANSNNPQKVTSPITPTQIGTSLYGMMDEKRGVYVVEGDELDKHFSELIKLGGKPNKERTKITFEAWLKQDVDNLIFETYDSKTQNRVIRMVWIKKKVNFYLDQLYHLRNLTNNNIISAHTVKQVLKNLNNCPYEEDCDEEDKHAVMTHINVEKDPNYHLQDDAAEHLACSVAVLYNELDRRRKSLKKTNITFTQLVEQIEEKNIKSARTPKHRQKFIEKSIVHIATFMAGYLNVTNISPTIMLESVLLFMPERMRKTTKYYLNEIVRHYDRHGIEETKEQYDIDVDITNIIELEERSHLILEAAVSLILSHINKETAKSKELLKRSYYYSKNVGLEISLTESIENVKADAIVYIGSSDNLVKLLDIGDIDEYEFKLEEVDGVHVAAINPSRVSCETITNVIIELVDEYNVKSIIMPYKLGDEKMQDEVWEIMEKRIQKITRNDNVRDVQFYIVTDPKQTQIKEFLQTIRIEKEVSVEVKESEEKVVNPPVDVRSDSEDSFAMSEPEVVLPISPQVENVIEVNEPQVEETIVYTNDVVVCEPIKDEIQQQLTTPTIEPPQQQPMTPTIEPLQQPTYNPPQQQPTTPTIESIEIPQQQPTYNPPQQQPTTPTIESIEVPQQQPTYNPPQPYQPTYNPPQPYQPQQQPTYNPQPAYNPPQPIPIKPPKPQPKVQQQYQLLPAQPHIGIDDVTQALSTTHHIDDIRRGQFFSKSRVVKDDLSDPMWRRKFSNESTCVIRIGENAFPSVSHYFYYRTIMQFELEHNLDNSLSKTFIVEPTGDECGMTAKANFVSITKHLEKKYKGQWTLFWKDWLKVGGRYEQVIRKGLKAKFTQHEHLRQLLLETKKHNIHLSYYFKYHPKHALSNTNIFHYMLCESTSSIESLQKAPNYQSLQYRKIGGVDWKNRECCMLGHNMVGHILMELREQL